MNLKEGKNPRSFFIGPHVGYGMFTLRVPKFITSIVDTELKEEGSYQSGRNAYYGITIGKKIPLKNDKFNIEIFIGGGTSQSNYKYYNKLGNRIYENPDIEKDFNQSGEELVYKGGVMLTYKLLIMLFNSVEFIFFFLIVFFSYWFLFNKNLKFQNLLILFSSYFFYAWWDWRFLSLIIISSLTDYLVGLQIEKSNNKIHKLRALKFSLIINIGILVVFKYYNFFIDNFTLLLDDLDIDSNLTLLNIILPVGISFYTFQTLSYSIDIYNGKINANKDIISFFAFVAFFPQLVAGPIERAKNLLPQFLKERKFNYDFAISGCRLILIGLFKKMVIADNLSVVVDAIYANPTDFLGFPSLIATIFFAFQIYCDFSGYSDIAIGIARLLGFKLMTNFKTPYFSKSLTDFWRNWHISLSSWFKDYVYIPLGGGKMSEKRIYLNIMITFLLSGFWHGANWTFIIWGAIHGIGLILEKKFITIISNLKIILFRFYIRVFH